jgi:ABC-type transporter Mla subunit MlaD
MRKWLVFIAVLVILMVGVAVWLAGKADTGKPDASEVRVEIENVL